MVFGKMKISQNVTSTTTFFFKSYRNVKLKTDKGVKFLSGGVNTERVVNQLVLSLFHLVVKLYARHHKPDTTWKSFDYK